MALVGLILTKNTCDDVLKDINSSIIIDLLGFPLFILVSFVLTRIFYFLGFSSR